MIRIASRWMLWSTLVLLVGCGTGGGGAGTSTFASPPAPIISRASQLRTVAATVLQSLAVNSGVQFSVLTATLFPPVGSRNAASLLGRQQSEMQASTLFYNPPLSFTQTTGADGSLTEQYFDKANSPAGSLTIRSTGSATAPGGADLTIDFHNIQHYPVPINGTTRLTLESHGIITSFSSTLELPDGSTAVVTPASQSAVQGTIAEINWTFPDDSTAVQSPIEGTVSVTEPTGANGSLYYHQVPVPQSQAGTIGPSEITYTIGPLPRDFHAGRPLSKSFGRTQAPISPDLDGGVWKGLNGTFQDSQGDHGEYRYGEDTSADISLVDGLGNDFDAYWFSGQVGATNYRYTPAGSSAVESFCIPYGSTTVSDGGCPNYDDPGVDVPFPFTPARGAGTRSSHRASR